jgi:hypothetical protein
MGGFSLPPDELALRAGMALRQSWPAPALPSKAALG